MSKKIILNFYGHAMFTLELPEDSLIIGFDPYNEQVKTNLPDVKSDLVLVSHHHFDHDNTGLFKGSPKIIDSPGNHTFHTIDIEGIPSYHDKDQGSQRGRNIIFKLKIGDFNLAHLGDLGHIPDPDTLKGLKNLDLLMIPVGGVYTIDYKEAMKVIDRLRPKIAVPMHFKEKDIHTDVSDINSFKDLAAHTYPIKEFFKSTEISSDEILKDTVIWAFRSV